MKTLLIKQIASLVSCDDEDRVYENVDLYAENGVIRAIGQNLDKAADETIDARHMLCYPGLINTHHHLYQQFSRNLPQVQNMELFDWLKTLYEIWKNLDADVIRLSSLTGHGRADEARLHDLLRPPLRLPGGRGRPHRHAVCCSVRSSESAWHSLARLDGPVRQRWRPAARFCGADGGRNHEATRCAAH